MIIYNYVGVRKILLNRQTRWHILIAVMDTFQICTHLYIQIKLVQYAFLP